MPVPENYKKPKMSHNVDGNIFSIIGRAMAVMKKAKYSDALQEQMANEVRATNSYDEALQTAMKWVDIV